MAAQKPSPIILDRRFLESVLPMNLQHLQELEDHISKSNCPHSPGMTHFTFGRTTSWAGTTPLLLACQHGELDSVKHIVESWREVDVCASATFYSNLSQQSQSRIEKVTPLFIAALYGYDKIVRYLLEKGANVSVKTSNKNGSPEYDGLTPLYAAVSDREYNPRRPLLEQLEERNAVVRTLLEFGADPVADSFRPFKRKPMWMEPMCGVDSITALIDHGLDLKRRNPQTGEALLLSVMSRTSFYTEEGSLAIIKKLVDKEADLLARDASGFTPLLRAADDTHNDGRLNLSILDFLLKRDEYSSMEKIEAMELAGATILSRAENSPHFPKALDYWRRALHLRHQMGTTEESGSPKKILGWKIGRHLEWNSFAELDRLVLHPDEYRIQALLVKLRILSGSNSQRRHHSLLSQYINHISDSTILEDGEKFTQILDIRLEMFDLMIRHQNPLQIHSTAFLDEVKRYVDELVSTLSTLHVDHPSLLSFEKLKTALDLILLATDQPLFKKDRPPFKITYDGIKTMIISDFGPRFSASICHLLEMMFHPPAIPNEPEKNSLIQSLRLLGHCRLGLLLLRACKKIADFKALALVRVLLEAGADPNGTVGERHGDAPLHIVARMSDRQLGDAAGLLLLEFGAKIHQVNRGGKTALDIWINWNERKHKWNEDAGGWSARPEWCLPVQTLVRLAARVIRVNEIPYDDEETPAVLHSLISSVKM